MKKTTSTWKESRVDLPVDLWIGDWLRCTVGVGILLVGACCLWSCEHLSSGPSYGPSESEKREIKLGNPRRIISLSPNVTDILEGVGAFDRVVAVSDYCTYPPSVESLPRVGGWQNTSLEEVISLRSDLVIMAEAQAPFINNKLQALGNETLVVPGMQVSFNW